LGIGVARVTTTARRLPGVEIPCRIIESLLQAIALLQRPEWMMVLDMPSSPHEVVMDRGCPSSSSWCADATSESPKGLRSDRHGLCLTAHSWSLHPACLSKHLD
jgi:hypothetical protein